MSMRSVAAGFAVLTIVPFSAAVAAGTPMPTVRVLSEQAAVFERTDPKSAVVLMAPAGTLFEVIDKEGDWYWVLLARDANGSRHAGWVEGSRIEVVVPAAPRVAPRTLTGQIDDAPSAFGSAASAATEQSDARVRKALSELEEARRQYEAVTKRSDEAR